MAQKKTVIILLYFIIVHVNLWITYVDVQNFLPDPLTQSQSYTGRWPTDNSANAVKFQTHTHGEANNTKYDHTMMHQWNKTNKLYND